MGELVRFLRRHLLLAGGLGAVAAIVAGVYLQVFQAPLYRATASVVIAPPEGSSRFRPPALAPQSYQRLLESRPLVAETKRRLIEQGVLQPGQPLGVGRQLSSRLLEARDTRRTTVPQTALLELVVELPQADAVATAANTWAQVFLDQAREMVAATTLAQIQVVEAEYPRVRGELAALEVRQAELSDSWDLLRRQGLERWQQRLDQYQRETGEQEAAFSAESARLLAERANLAQLATQREVLAASRQAYADLEARLARLDGDELTRRSESAAARAQLAEIPRFLQQRRGMTDEALWRSVVEEGGTLPADLQQLGVTTEEANPLHLEVSRRLTELEIELASLVAQREQLQADAQALGEKIERLDGQVRHEESALAELKRQREIGLAALLASRAGTLQVLLQQQKDEEQALDRQQGLVAGQLARDVDLAKQQLQDLTNLYKEGAQARSQLELTDARMGLAAVPPDNPLPGSIGLKVLVALVGGALLGLVVGLLRELAAWSEA